MLAGHAILLTRAVPAWSKVMAGLEAGGRVPGLQIFHCAFACPIADGGQVLPDLLVQACEAFPLRIGQLRVGLLVDDRIEAFVQGQGQSLLTIFRGRHIRGAGAGNLADVVGDVHALDDRVRSDPSGAYFSTA